ncbi:MAG: hypothetical protein HY094_06175 [Candidatus Melainabacteria bacterium]|nr:hypothetical protein [Candidatus Melainabacteria bacterium]
MSEITFISNKTRKQTFKYFFVIVFAVISWILQVSVFNRFLYFDTAPNLLLLGCIYWGLILGPTFGAVFGIVSSFFCASILYDHIFYFSYPIIGILSGFLIKNIFSDELLFFILLSFLFTIPLEILNGWQYNLANPINIFDRYLMIGFNSAVLNLFLSPFFYWIMKFITKKSALG